MSDEPSAETVERWRTGRIAARPRAGADGGGPTADAPFEPGLQYPLGRSPGAPVLLVPRQPVRSLLVLLHGAGSDPLDILGVAEGEADARGLLVVAPKSRGRTWDVVEGGFGPDVALLDAALSTVFGRVPLDPARVAIGGFSDGASAALSLGLVNGNLFRHVLAFSPGFVAARQRAGAPRVFVSHGTRDAVLPVDRCSRRIVPALRAEGLAVDYREFDGPHTVPPDLARAALDLLA